MINNTPVVYLIPTVLYENVNETIPSYIINSVNKCDVFFVENERTARRYLKSIWKEIVIDNYEWFSIHKAEDEVKQAFLQKLAEGKNIGIISEAGCPGIADPGQILVMAAQEKGIKVQPLVGPSSILLALMASGMNGQQFSFLGYLPIDSTDRKKAIKTLENASASEPATKIFIETPYRNNQLVQQLLDTCKPNTKLCIAVNITATDESIVTKTISQWKKTIPELHKKPAIFLIQA